ncbi:hypothetical protein DL93DRAFT_2219505 [Clavulina sp. PMI_390]|nr:hypothetical protein DL93DRAFT_2219505 [Clavulina sp. PMI_390]
MVAPFGSFAPLCHSVPSYPICNLFFRQLARDSPSDLNAPNGDLGAFERVAPVGIDITCGIPRMVDGKLGNIANIIAIAISIFVTAFLIYRVSRRVAAVGRVELQNFLVLYLVSLPLQLVTTGAMLKQSSTVLVIITAVHMGVVAALFWTLLANGIVATQAVEDGTMSSLVPFWLIGALFFAATTYISLDTAFGFSSTFTSHPPSELRGIALFVLTSIWPAFCAFAYFVIMIYVVTSILREGRPVLYYAAAAFLFVLSQLAYFLLSKVICKGSSSKLDGSFVATVLETLSVAMIVASWISITEESWEDEPYYPS